MNAAFWRGRRVFLTGHTGFKGGWLVLWLTELGAEVHGFALAPPTGPNLFTAAGLSKRLASSTLADIRDAAALERAMAAARPEIVLHLAAQPLVRHSYAEPVETFAVNVMGTINLLEAVRRTPGVQAVVNVTTDKCYENRGWVWGYRENEPMGGNDPYSNSKACAELVTAAFRHSFFGPGKGIALASARAGNVIGGGDWAAHRLVPDLVTSFAAGRSAVVRNRHSIRPWQHVLDPLNGYLLLAQAMWQHPDRYAEGWNFGPDATDTWTVGRLADRLAALWGGCATWTDLTAGDQPHEEHTLTLDCAKAHRVLGWKPRWDTDTALAHTVDWYRVHHGGGDLRQTMHRQIHDHGAAADSAAKER